MIITPAFTTNFTTFFGSSATAAKNAWIAASQIYTSQFSDPIHVNVTVDAVSDQSVLGESLTQLLPITYANLRSALVADATSASDQTALGPGGSIPASDPSSSGNWWLARAQAKALGVIADDTTSDGTTTFGAGFSYTFSGTVTSGTYDFVAVCAHEISEVMGRLGLSGATVGTTTNSFSLIDIFAFTGAGTRGMTAGPSENFSINNGTTLLKLWNDATANAGDSRDWASGTNDAYNAFSNTGVSEPVSALDLQLMDVLGYTQGTASGVRLDKVGGAQGTTSPLIATASGPDFAAGDLVITCSIHSVTFGATATISDALNNGVLVDTTIGASQVGHYGMGYSLSTTRNTTANTNTFTFSPAPNAAATAIASFAFPTIVSTISVGDSTIASEALSTGLPKPPFGISLVEPYQIGLINLIGDGVIESQTNPLFAGVQGAWQYVCNNSGIISELQLYLQPNETVTDLFLGVYADSGGVPGALVQGLHFGAPVQSTAGWVTLTGFSISVGAGTTFWLSALPIGGTLNYTQAPSGTTPLLLSAAGRSTLQSPWSDSSGGTGHVGRVSFQALGLGIPADTPVVTEPTQLTEIVLVLFAGTNVIGVQDGTALSESQKVQLVSFVKVSDATATSETVPQPQINVGVVSVSVSDATTTSENFLIGFPPVISDAFSLPPILETLNVSESVGQILVSWLRITDTTATSETVRVSFSFAPSASDSTSTSESVAVARVLGIVATESTRTSETQTLFQGVPSSIATTPVVDSVATGDAVQITIAPFSISVSDFTVLDEIPQVVIFVGFQITLQEGSALAERFAAFIPTYLIPATETVTTSETATETLVDILAVSDSTATSESFTVRLVPRINVNDSIQTSESAVVAVHTPGTVNVTDFAQGSEAVNVSITFPILLAVADFVHTSESLKVAAAPTPFAVRDSAKLSEAVRLSVPPGLVSIRDLTHLTETVASPALSLTSASSEATFVIEAVGAQVPIAGLILAADGARTGEAVTATLSAPQISVGDTISWLYPGGMPPGSGIFMGSALETVSVVVPIHVAVTDTVTAAETRTLALPIRTSVTDTVRPGFDPRLYPGPMFPSSGLFMESASSERVNVAIASQAHLADSTTVSETVALVFSTGFQVHASDLARTSSPSVVSISRRVHSPPPTVTPSYQRSVAVVAD